MNYDYDRSPNASPIVLHLWLIGVVGVDAGVGRLSCKLFVAMSLCVCVVFSFIILCSVQYACHTMRLWGRFSYFESISVAMPKSVKCAKINMRHAHTHAVHQHLYPDIYTSSYVWHYIVQCLVGIVDIWFSILIDTLDGWMEGEGDFFSLCRHSCRASASTDGAVP